MAPRVSAPADPSKQLKVKINVCKRMQREVRAYEDEVKTNEARIQKMRDDGRDPHDIRKQEEVLGESYMMIPDSKGRLARSFEELRSYMEENESEGFPTETVEEVNALLRAYEESEA